MLKAIKVSFYNLYQQSYVKREHISIQINIVLNASFVLALISINLMNILDMLAQCAYKMTFKGDFCRNFTHLYSYRCCWAASLCYEQLGGRILLSERSTAGVIVPDVFDAIMQTDPIRWQEETITAVIVVLLMSLCLCAEAGVSREDAREGWEVRSPALLFFSDVGWSDRA